MSETLDQWARRSGDGLKIDRLEAELARLRSYQWARRSGDGLKIDRLEAELARLRSYLAALETDSEFRCSIGPLEEWEPDV